MASSRRNYFTVFGGATIAFFIVVLVHTKQFKWNSYTQLSPSTIFRSVYVTDQSENKYKMEEIQTQSIIHGDQKIYSETEIIVQNDIIFDGEAASNNIENATSSTTVEPFEKISPSAPFPAFATLLLEFDWADFSTYTDRSDQKTKTKIETMESRQEDLMRIITPYLTMEPLVPVNAACIPTPLTPPRDLVCEGHGNIFAGQLRTDSTTKIGILIQFGFGVDVLEIYLNEVYDVVDRFFIIESTRAHFRTIKKGLIWERVKNQPRFRKFDDKVVHLVIDDAEAAITNTVFQVNTNHDRPFEMEALQERLRWEKFIEWNTAHKFFSSQDLLGIGDADEIPSRQMVHMIRYCQLNGNRFDVGIWFSFGNINSAFRTDYPVSGQPYSLGDPTFWTVEAATAYAYAKEPPTRMRGTSTHYVLGGMHMTHSGYLPFQIARRISCSECWPFLPSTIDFVIKKLKAGDLRPIERYFGAVPYDISHRDADFHEVEGELREVAVLPWFYSCNRNRYPSWEGKHDTRLD